MYITVNVDVKGSVLTSTRDYTFISESTASTIETLENGNTITTYTNTKVWQLNAPVELVLVTSAEVGNSGILASTLEEAGAQGEAMHSDAESQFYWAWFAVNECSDDKVCAFKTDQVKMTDGSIWYTIVFYVEYI